MYFSLLFVAPIFTFLKKLIDRYFFILLLFMVLISYGQILWMQPWQDDNALFFKIVHIEEAAGFLGKGVFGEGPYRYTATPYYIIYRLFGLNISAFFGLALIFYFLAASSVYFLLKVLVNKKTGMLAAMLYATNYVTSDSFIRLFNSVSTSLSVILLSFLIISYWKFLQTKKLILFPFAVFIFLLACEFAYVRSHYLIAVVVSMEVILSLFPLSIRSFGKSTLRLIPFILIFIWQYILNGDARLGEGVNNINLILSGKFENLFSIFTGFGQLVFPDKLSNLMPEVTSEFITNPYYRILAINAFIFLLFNLLILKFVKRKYTKLIYFLISLFWLVASRWLFVKLSPMTPYLVLLVGYIGGLSILGFFIAGRVLSSTKRKLYFLFLLLILLNIFSYIVYDPVLFYGVYNSRYLVHSFVGLVGMLAIIGTNFKSRLPFIVILGWGVLNLFLNIQNQREIGNLRSYPINSFHQQLKQSIGNLPKGSILYFDLQDDSIVKTRFSDAIASSQMPETTAISWRFGLDRDDFNLTTDYVDLTKAIADKQITLNKVYSFWYTKDGLFDTTRELRKSLVGVSKKEAVRVNLPIRSKLKIESANEVNVINQEDMVINLGEPISSITPVELQFTIRAESADLESLKFPLYRQGVDQAVVTFPLEQRSTAILYGIYKDSMSERVTYTVSDSWEKRVADNLYDQNYQTIWQSDRVLWQRSSSSVTIDMKELTDINRLVWINGLSNNTPIEYSVEGSRDGNVWLGLKKVADGKRLGDGEFQIVEFEPQRVRFVRMIFLKTLNNDSPAIAEIWPVPLDYAKLDLYRVEYLLRDLFGYLPNAFAFSEGLRVLNRKGSINVYWLSDKSKDWLTEANAKINIVYDGIPHQYSVKIPAGGTELKKIRFGNIQILGDVELTAVSIKR